MTEVKRGVYTGNPKKRGTIVGGVGGGGGGCGGSKTKKMLQLFSPYHASFRRGESKDGSVAVQKKWMAPKLVRAGPVQFHDLNVKEKKNTSIR